jgi:type VI protein secretion system component VasF
MAKLEEFELLSATSNAVVARHLGRHFPGILIQGDSLRIFLDEIDELIEEANAQDFETVKGVANTIRERLVDLLTHYETVLEKEGYELPYVKRVRL